MTEGAIAIAGPAGRIEAVVEPPLGAAGDAQPAPLIGGPIVVLCHPHPQFGGSMHDGVLHTASGVLRQAGTTSVRFNFRGVGASEGTHDNGVGEVEDIIAVVEHVRGEYRASTLIVVGYSFGAATALNAAERIRPDRLILIAPPLGRMPTPEHAAAERVALIHGTADDFVAAAAVAGFSSANPAAAVHAIDGADHFFSSHHSALAAAVAACIAA